MNSNSRLSHTGYRCHRSGAVPPLLPHLTAHSTREARGVMFVYSLLLLSCCDGGGRRYGRVCCSRGLCCCGRGLWRLRQGSVAGAVVARVGGEAGAGARLTPLVLRPPVGDVSPSTGASRSDRREVSLRVQWPSGLGRISLLPLDPQGPTLDLEPGPISLGRNASGSCSRQSRAGPRTGSRPPS